MQGRDVVRTSTEWTRYFAANAGVREFGEFGALTLDEKKAVAKSVQEFQLGESGEGLHLMRNAKKWVEKSEDQEYLMALRLFIAEEIRHSKELGAVLDANGIERLKKCWVDSVFRWMRRAAGLELSIAVLVAAEIVAKVYYAALRDATECGHLKRLCERILIDEVRHIEFQGERLAILRERMSLFSLVWRDVSYGLFFRSALVVVWIKHGRAMRRGGYGLVHFWRESVHELHDAMRIMDPRRYAWGEASGRFILSPEKT